MHQQDGGECIGRQTDIPGQLLMLMENDARDPTPVLDGPTGRNLLTHLARSRQQPKCRGDASTKSENTPIMKHF
jgi:hypothetical protein